MDETMNTTVEFEANGNERESEVIPASSIEIIDAKAEVELKPSKTETGLFVAGALLAGYGAYYLVENSIKLGKKAFKKIKSKIKKKDDKDCEIEEEVADESTDAVE